MSQRDWHATGGTALATPPLADAQVEACRGPRDGAGECAAGEEDFPALTPSQQQDLLAHAERQGLVPIGPALTAASPPVEADAVRAALAQIFASPTLSPAPFASPIDLLDRELDSFQTDAVARALQTPDLLVLQGPPGTGKKRVVAEIAYQAAQQGWRALLIGPAAAVDALLERLKAAPCVVPLRCLGGEESLTQLPAAAAALTLDRQESAIASQIRSRALHARTAAEERVTTLTGLHSVWPELSRLAIRESELTAQLDDARARRVRVADDVRHEAETIPEASDFASAVQALTREHTTRVAALEAESVELQKRRAEGERLLHEARTQLNGLRPLAEARQSGRWWTGVYWRARMDKGLVAKIAEQESVCNQAEYNLVELAEREQQLAAERERVEGVHREHRTRLIDDESTRRTVELLAQEAARAADLAGVRREMHPLLERIFAAGISKPGAGPEAIRAAEAGSVEALRLAEQELNFARQWETFAGAEAEPLARRFRGTVNLVAGPLSCLTTDAYFADPSSRESRFDLLIVLDAHQISEAEFLAAARRANRWVLVGEPPPRPVEPRPVMPPRTNRPPAAPARPARAVPDFFTRLANQLHHEPWSVESGRLCCRLHPVAPDERRHLESERLADNPDIELRILTPPTGEPVLAEIIFPGSTTPARAKEYLLRELNEMSALPRCRTAYWSEEPSSLLVRFEVCEPDERLAVGEGVAEWLCGTRTVGFSFECPTWDRARAEAWLQQHVLKHDPGRVATLAVPHGRTPGLGAWLNGFLSGSHAVNAPKTPEPAVFFLPVPAHPGRRELFSTPPESAGRRSAPQRQGGAGYETDLADPRGRERLSPDLLKSLPSRGFVNLPEADRVVQKLQELSTRLPGASFGVAAPYSSQAALIRRLAERSPRLAGVHYAGPDGWEHRVCDVLVVSLTRSHVSRAVTYGDEPALPPRLWLRARKHLFIAGDPGTLVRRARWEGAVDHFDAIAGETERAWVDLLVRYLRGDAPLMALFQLLESERA